MRVSFATWRRATGAVLAVVTMGLLASGGSSPAVSAVAPVDDGVVAATIKDQTELAVTVYNSNIALVRDVRQVVDAQRHPGPAVSRHRGDGEPGDGALPLA